MDGYYLICYLVVGFIGLVKDLLTASLVFFPCWSRAGL